MPRERESQKGVYRRKKSSPHLLLGFGANHELGVVKAEPAVFTFQHKQTNRDLDYRKAIMNYRYRTRK
jgi:hypothetical protein